MQIIKICGKEGNMAKNKEFEENKDNVKTEKDNKTTMESKTETDENNDTDNENIEKNEQCYETLEKEFNALKEENTSLKERIASYEAKEMENIIESVLFEIENSGVKDKKVLEDIRKEAERFSLDNINDYYYIARGMAFSYIQEHNLEIKKEDEGINRFAGKEKLDFSKNINKTDPNIYG